MPYLEGGEEIEVLAEVDGNCMVCMLYESEDHDDGLARGDAFVLRKSQIFEEPPKVRMESANQVSELKLAELKKTLDQKHSEFNSLLQQMESAKHEYAKLSNRESLPTAMLRVMQVIEGKVTHIVVAERYYVWIKKFDSSAREGFDVCTLSAQSDGTIRWSCAYQRDIHRTVIPCLSLDEAKQTACDALVKSFDQRNMSIQEVLKFANEASVNLPQRLLGEFERWQEKERQDKMKKLLADQEKVAAELAELKGTAS